jgi:hypothetical protein
VKEWTFVQCLCGWQVGLIIFYAFRGSSKLEEAAKSFRNAGITFQLGEEWCLAAYAFRKSASLFSKLENRYVNAAANYEDAARCCKKFDVDGEICCWLLLLC